MANPKKCDVCGVGLSRTYIDAKTKIGPWATMCSACHMKHGVGAGGLFGLGIGQEFDVRTGKKIKG